MHKSSVLDLTLVGHNHLEKPLPRCHSPYERYLNFVLDNIILTNTTEKLGFFLLICWDGCVTELVQRHGVPVNVSGPDPSLAFGRYQFTNDAWDSIWHLPARSYRRTSS